MVILFVVPVFWPFLLLYVVMKLWKITVPLMVVGLLYWLVQADPVVGYSLVGLIMVVALWQAHLRQPSSVRQEDSEWTRST